MKTPVQINDNSSAKKPNSFECHNIDDWFLANGIEGLKKTLNEVKKSQSLNFRDPEQKRIFKMLSLDALLNQSISGSKMLLHKTALPEKFERDEFTKEDVKAYSDIVFLKKYPQARAFANYFNTEEFELGQKNRKLELAREITKALESRKWLFYNYNLGCGNSKEAHWVLIVISPDREVLCLNSINQTNTKSTEGTKQQNFLSLIDGINCGFKGAGLVKFKITNREYQGFSTSTNLQSGFHSCFLMEEIVKSICEVAKKKKIPAKNLWQILALEKVLEIDLGEANQEITEENRLVIERILEGRFLHGHAKDFLSHIPITKKTSISETGTRQKIDFSKAKKNVLQLYQEKLTAFDIEADFTMKNIKEKIDGEEDVMTKKPTDEQIFLPALMLLLCSLKLIIIEFYNYPIQFPIKKNLVK